MVVCVLFLQIREKHMWFFQPSSNKCCLLCDNTTRNMWALRPAEERKGFSLIAREAPFLYSDTPFAIHLIPPPPPPPLPPLTYSSPLLTMSLISTLQTAPLLQSARQMSFLFLTHKYKYMRTRTHTPWLLFTGNTSVRIFSIHKPYINNK